MRILRLRHADGESYALQGSADATDLELLDGVPWHDGIRRTGRRIPWEEAELLAPVSAPGKIIGIGLNYPAPGTPPQRPERPVVFLKASSSIVAAGTPVELPQVDGEIWHEGELAVIIGRRARDVRVEEAAEHVFGCMIADDVSARDQMYAETQWDRAKGYDTFCPLGTAIVPGLDPEGHEITTWVDGEIRKQGHTRDLLFPVPELIAYLSRSWTLHPGDVILTGTPAGDGAVEPGQQVRIAVSGLGELEHPVVAREQAS